MRTALLACLLTVGMHHNDWLVIMGAMAIMIAYQSFRLAQCWHELARLEQEASFLQNYVDSEG